LPTSTKTQLFVKENIQSKKEFGTGLTLSSSADVLMVCGSNGYRQSCWVYAQAEQMGATNWIQQSPTYSRGSCQNNDEECFSFSVSEDEGVPYMLPDASGFIVGGSIRYSDYGYPGVQIYRRKRVPIIFVREA